jgi:undecaprenyl diphosphate synthase
MSSECSSPDADRLSSSLPRHVAIIMDGNGRWAERRHLPRYAGHRAGVQAVRGVVQACGEKGIEALTLFAFSSENWRRPAQEVGLLMDLFLTTLRREVDKLHRRAVRLRFIGDRQAFAPKLRARIDAAEELTADNRGLNLAIAVNYGGRWDIAEAARGLGERIEAGELRAADITPELLAGGLALHDLPEPDMFIRTGGEQRISNFLLWQLAYTELYFTDTLWPDFDTQAFDAALDSFARRQRRFGLTGEQVERLRGA